ncbi:hypothetical protein Pcinc_038751 [Petrolisthes cinctipes]|uniref:MYND-type domain-containing protein n=1 Tax=Petrolisthes cinctipes TaxID=88211 RepID=A0AAE1EK03_PETCI|nr:hypothetical protein Pcinc_038751 [Petrolisthes cinctipes]
MAGPQQRTLTEAPVTLTAPHSLINNVARGHQTPAELYAKLSDSNSRVVINQTGSNHHAIPRPASRRSRPCSLCGTTAVRSQSAVIPGSPLDSNEQPVVLLHRLEDGLPQGDVNSLRAYGTIRLLPVHSPSDGSNQDYDSDNGGEVEQRKVNNAMAHAVYHSEIHKEEASKSRAQYSSWSIGCSRESKYPLSETNSLHRSDERYLASKVEQTNLCNTEAVNSGETINQSFSNRRIHNVRRDTVPYDREERGGSRVQQQSDVSERGGRKTVERGDSGYTVASSTLPLHNNDHSASQPRPSQRHSSPVFFPLSPVSSETSNALTHASPDSSTAATTTPHNQAMSCQSLRQSDLTEATTKYVPTSSQINSSAPHHSSSPPSSPSVHSSCHQPLAPSSPYTPMSVVVPFSASSPTALSSSPSSSQPLLSPPSPSSVSPPGSPPSPPSSPFSLNSPTSFTEANRSAHCPQNLPPSSPYSPRSLPSAPNSPTSLPSRSASPPSPSPSLGSCPSLELYQGHLYSHTENQSEESEVQMRHEEQVEEEGDAYTSSLTPSPISSRVNSSLRSSSALSSERDIPEEKNLVDTGINSAASSSSTSHNSTKASSLQNPPRSAVAAAAAAHNQPPQEIQTHTRLTDKAKVQTMWNKGSGDAEDALVHQKSDSERMTCEISQASQVSSKCSDSSSSGGGGGGGGGSDDGGAGDGTELERQLNDYNNKSSSSMKLVLKVKNPSTQSSLLETEKKECNKENGIPKIVLTRKGNGPNREYSCSNRLRNEDQRLESEVVQNKKHKSKKSKRDKLKIKKVKKIVKSDKHKRHLELFGEDSNDSCEMPVRFQVNVNGLPEEEKARKEHQQQPQLLSQSAAEDEEEEEEDGEEEEEDEDKEQKEDTTITPPPPTPAERHQRDYQLPLSFPTLDLESPPHLDHNKKEFECTVSQSSPVEKQKRDSNKKVELQIMLDELKNMSKQELPSLKSHATNPSNPDKSDDSSPPPPPPPPPPPHKKSDICPSTPSSPARKPKQKSVNKTVPASKKVEQTAPRSKRDRYVKKTKSGSNSDACLWVSFGMNAPVPVLASDMDLSPLRSTDTRREGSDNEIQSLPEDEELPDLCNVKLDNNDHKHSHRDTEREGKPWNKKHSSNKRLNKEGDKVSSKRSQEGNSSSRSSQSRLRSNRSEVKRSTRPTRSCRMTKRGSGQHRTHSSGRRGRGSWRRTRSPSSTHGQSEASHSSIHSRKQSLPSRSTSYSPTHSTLHALTHSSTHSSADSPTHSATHQNSETLEEKQEIHTTPTEHLDNATLDKHKQQQPSSPNLLSDTNGSTSDHSNTQTLNVSHTEHQQGIIDIAAHHQTAVPEPEAITQNQVSSVNQDQCSNHSLNSTSHNMTDSKHQYDMQHQVSHDLSKAQDVANQNLNSTDLNTTQSQKDTQEIFTTPDHLDSQLPDQKQVPEDDDNNSQNQKSIQGEDHDQGNDEDPQRKMNNQEVLSRSQSPITTPDLNNTLQTLKSSQDQIAHTNMKATIALTDNICHTSDINEATSGKSSNKVKTDDDTHSVDRGGVGAARTQESVAMFVPPSQLSSSSSSTVQSESCDGETSEETMYYRPKKIRKVDHSSGSIKTCISFNNSIEKHPTELNNITPANVNSASTPQEESSHGMNLTFSVQGKDSEPTATPDTPTQELTPRPTHGLEYVSETSRLSDGKAMETENTENLEPVIKHQAQTPPVSAAKDQLQQPLEPATSHYPHLTVPVNHHPQQQQHPTDPPTLHSQHPPENQVEEKQSVAGPQKRVSKSESKAGKSEGQTESETGKKNEVSDKADSPSRKSIDSSGSGSQNTVKKGRRRIIRKEKTGSGGGKNWALQKALHRREVQHEEERGKRLAQEIKGFNWLEEKIKNGSLHPSAGAAAGSGHSVSSSSSSSSPPTPSTPKEPPQRTLSSTSSSSSSSAEPSTPLSPSCSKFVFAVRKKDEGDGRKNSSSGGSSGLRGHLQIAVPPFAPSSRVTALPKRRPTPPTPTTSAPTPTHNTAVSPTTPLAPYCGGQGGHTMTVQSPLFSTSHSHQEPGGRLFKAGGPGLAKTSAVYEYQHQQLSDSNKATLYSTTSHTKATLYGVHDDSLELFYDSVKDNNYYNAQGKTPTTTTTTKSSNNNTSSSPFSSLYGSVQNLKSTTPSKHSTSSSCDDPTPSTPSATTNTSPSPSSYQLVWQQQQQQQHIPVSSHSSPTNSSEPKRFSHKHTLLRRCFRELLKSESESSPEPPLNGKTVEPDLNVSQMCSEVRESEPQEAVSTCFSVATVAADTSVDKPSLPIMTTTDYSMPQPQPPVTVDSHLSIATASKPEELIRVEETLTPSTSPDSAFPLPPIKERRSSLSVKEENQMSFQAMIKTEVLDPTANDNDDNTNKETTSKSQSSKVANAGSADDEHKKPETSKREVDVVEDVSKSIRNKVIESITDDADLEVKYLKRDIKNDPTKGKEDSEIQSNLILSVLYKELMRTRQEVEKLRRVQELMLTEKGDKKETTEEESKADSKTEDSMEIGTPEDAGKCEKRKHEDVFPVEDEGGDSASKKSKISIRSDLLSDKGAAATTTTSTVQETPNPVHSLQHEPMPLLSSTTTVSHPSPQQPIPETVISLIPTDLSQATTQAMPGECIVQPRLSPGVVKPSPILPKVGCGLTGSGPGLPRASPGMSRVSHGTPTISPALISSSPVLPMNSPTMPRSSPGIPRSSPGIPRSSPGIPRSSPGVPRSSPGMTRNSPGVPHESSPGVAPMSSPVVTRASPVILQTQYPPVTSPTSSVIVPHVSPTTLQLSPHISHNAGSQACHHATNFTTAVTSIPTNTNSIVAPKQLPYEQPATSPIVSQPMPPPIASIVLGNALCSPTGTTRVSPVVSRTSPVITRTNSLPGSTVSTADAALVRSLSPNKLRSAFGISNSDVELMPVSAGLKPSYPEPYPQTFLKFIEHPQDNPILLNAFKGLRVHNTKEGGEIPLSQLAFRFPQEDPRRSLHAQPYETEIRRTAHSTSELPDFPPPSRKQPPPLKPASSLVRRHSDTLDPRSLNPALHCLRYPTTTTHPSLAGSHPQKTSPISSYSHPQSNQTQYPQVTQSGRRNSDASCSERSRECRMAIGLQHQYPQHITPVTGMMSLGPDKATIFPITPMAPSIRPFKNTTAPAAPMRSAMEHYQNENFLRSNMPFFEKLRENIQQARDTSLNVSDRGHLGQERLQPSTSNIDKPQQPQTFAPRVLVQESGPKTHVPPATYSAPHFSTPSHQHNMPGAMSSHPGHFPNTMHSGTSLHHLTPTGLPPTSHQTVPPARPNNATATNSRCNTDGSRSEKKQCLNCPQQARFLCSGCKKAWYCSEKCQRDHWITHNTACIQ